jgi:putative DNA primase/helicase
MVVVDFNKYTAEIDGVLSPPIRIVPGARKDVVDAVEYALMNSDCGLFQRGGLIVRIDWYPMKTWDEKDVYIQGIVECGNDFLLEVVTAVCEIIRHDVRKNADKACDSPDWVARTLKQRKTRLRLPILNGVTNCPIMRANGELVVTPGYHKETGIYFDPRGVKFPEIPDNPTREDALLKLERLKKLFSTFPFVDRPSHSVALSLLLTTVARRALDFAPMHAFDGPTAGTGKSMAVDVVSLVATGEQAGVVAHTEDQKEFDKHLSAILMRGIPLVAIDNCEGPLKGVLLNQTLTQPITECRILGKSESVQVRSNSTISANGNNLIIEGDTTRRAICGRMDAGVERPELLEFDYSPLDDARQNRAELVAAALTVLRAYHLAGRPIKKTLGSFQEWSHLVRGALLWLEEADPAATMEELRKHDPRQSALKTVMFEWDEEWKGRSMTVSEMIQRADAFDKLAGKGGEHVYPTWRDALMNVAALGNNVSNLRLGKWLSKVKDRPMIFEGFSYKISQDGVAAGRQRWVLKKTLLKL